MSLRYALDPDESHPLTMVSYAFGHNLAYWIWLWRNNGYQPVYMRLTRLWPDGTSEFLVVYRICWD